MSGLPDFLTQLRRVNTERYEAWVAVEPLMLCEHCGRAIGEGSTHCAPSLYATTCFQQMTKEISDEL